MTDEKNVTVAKEVIEGMSRTIEELRDENLRLWGFARLVEYINRSRGYPTPKEWNEIVSVAKNALAPAEQKEGEG